MIIEANLKVINSNSTTINIKIKHIYSMCPISLRIELPSIVLFFSYQLFAFNLSRIMACNMSYQILFNCFNINDIPFFI